jgi:hypothetical protein
MLPGHPRLKNRLMNIRRLTGESKIRPPVATFRYKRNGMNKIDSF